MSSHKRLASLATAAVMFTFVWSATGEAQILYPYPYPYRTVRDLGGAVRIEATPKDAEVYVDGYYAGIVDDFDGMFQRLHVAPGPHEITLYRNGYRSVTQRIYVEPDSTFKIKQKMDPLAPGDLADARPVPANPPPQQTRGPAPLPPRGPVGRRLPPPPNAPPPPAPPSAAQAATGTLAIRLQPADAEVSIDGQPWRVAEGQDRLLVDMSEGRHNVQVRKSGYVGYLTDVEVRRGETTTLTVNLRMQSS